jgi:hypothetical protein
MLIMREPHKNLEVHRGAEGWRECIANPPGHWQTHQGALRLARAWADSDPEFPPDLARAFWTTPFASFIPLIGIPAYEVPMPGGWLGAIPDLFVLGTISGELAVLVVQSKVLDEVGPSLDRWLMTPAPGRLRRLAFLKAELNLPDSLPDDTCCNLVHLAAAPLLEARRLKAHYAAMMVVAFSLSDSCRQEYAEFARLLHVTGRPGLAERVPVHIEPELWIGWVDAAEVTARASPTTRTRTRSASSGR